MSKYVFHCEARVFHSVLVEAESIEEARSKLDTDPGLFDNVKQTFDDYVGEWVGKEIDSGIHNPGQRH